MEFILVIAVTIALFAMLGGAAAAFGTDSRDGFGGEPVNPRMSWSEWISSRRG
jgi:hypothetical protein